MLPQHTFPGNVILSSRATSGLSPPVIPDPELEKLCTAHLTAAAKSIFSALEGTPLRTVTVQGDDDERDSFASMHPIWHSRPSTILVLHTCLNLLAAVVDSANPKICTDARLI